MDLNLTGGRDNFMAINLVTFNGILMATIKGIFMTV